MRILWIKTELLHPIDKGGRIRSYQMLRALSRQHHVTYLCLDDGLAASDAVERAREYAHEVVRVPFRPAPKMTAGYFADLLRIVALNPRKVERNDVKPAIHRQTEKEVCDRPQSEIASGEQSKVQKWRFAYELDYRK